MAWLPSLRTPLPRHILALCAVLLPQLLCAWTIELGDTRNDVLKAYGSPPSRMVTAARELFRYQEGELIIENGVVVEIRFRTKEPSLLNPGFIKESRAAEEAKKAAAEAAAAAEANAEAEKARLAALAALKARVEEVHKAPEKESLWLTPYIWLGVGGVLGALGLYLWLYRRLKKQAETASERKFDVPATHSLATSMKPSSLPRLMVLTRPNLDRLEWRVLDELVRSYLNTQGWVAKRVDVETNGTTRSLLWRRNEARPSACLCCIPALGAYLETEQVSKIEQSLEDESLANGFIITTGDFSSEARTHALKRRRVELVSGDGLMALFRVLPRKQHATIVSQALSGDFETPSCTLCETKLVFEESPQPRWLCSQHTDCHHAFPAPRTPVAAARA